MMAIIPQSGLLQLIILVMVGLGLLTIYTSRRAKKKFEDPEHHRVEKVRVWVVTAIIGTLITIAFGAIGGIYYNALSSNYKSCALRVESRHAFRIGKFKDFDTTAQLYDSIDAAFKTQDFTAGILIPGKPSLREALAEARASMDRPPAEGGFPELYLVRTKTADGKVHRADCPSKP